MSNIARCKCGNTLSLQRQEDGIDNCPACDPSQAEIDIDDLIDGIEYDITGKLDETDVMRRVLQLAKIVREYLI